MNNIFETINEYFVEMVRDVKSRDELKQRALLPLKDRQLIELPETNNMHDAFYVVMGSKFQDNPVKSSIFTLLFIVFVGFTIANFIIKIVN